ncbi:unnamed protein product [Coregonus sp. 'balchen']|nr:unnamed protein product [Coregonus sp. 'balchen']
MVLRSCCTFGQVLVWFRLGYVVLLWLCVTHFRCARAETKTVVQKDAEFDVTYNDTVTSDNQTIYAFNHTVSRNKTEGVRVTVDVLSEGAVSSPILFVVRQKQARKYPYAHVGRTLCQPPTRTLTETQYFFVDVSTLSSLGTQYQLRISRVDSFTLHTDKKFSFTASPSQPQYFKYVFPDGVDTVIVKVNSEMTFPCSCPVYDLDNNVAFIGMYQTMTKTAAITVQRKDFPSNSFYVVVVVKTEDEACGGPLRFYPLRPDELTDAGNRSKTLDVDAQEEGGASEPSGHVAHGDRYPSNPLQWHIPEGKTRCDSSLPLWIRLLCTLSSEAITDSIASDANYGYMGQETLKRRPFLTAIHHVAICIERSLESVTGRSRQESLSSVEEDDYDTLADIDSDKNIVRTKKYLCVSDLARKDKRVVNVTGNQDICYYNFLCAHPLGNLSAFNNILSNLGYVMLGLLFLLIVLQRDIIHSRALDHNDLNALHFGLFYAMGTALMMEGLLSACYHVCPNYTNFQFDTSFMYMIAGLCVLKLYQKRHPDINASAYTAYACLAALRSGERIQCMAMVCILFTAVVWGFALFFFFQGLSTWQKTPAESREHNRDCIVLSFFDDHDIWHFLSSIAMFGSFLVLLTMDDDLDNVQRDKIFVF